jgi:hypothetical protein
MTTMSAASCSMSNRFTSAGLRMVVLLVAVLIGLIASAAHAKSVRVRGYLKTNGTYVMPHYRTSPDRNPVNNYGMPGNFNPNTGRVSGGNPDTYLMSLCSRGNTAACSLLFGIP